MRKFLLAVSLSFLLLGCSSPTIDKVAFKGTTVEDLVDKPDRELMLLSPEKKQLPKGVDNGAAAVIISNNNLRAGTIERRLDMLQKYVCNLFKDPVGEVCNKDK